MVDQDGNQDEVRQRSITVQERTARPGRAPARPRTRPFWRPRWQGVARLGLVLGLVGFVAVVFLGVQKREAPVAPRVIDRLDPNAVTDSTGCEVKQAVGSQENFTLEATRCRTYEDGSALFFEGVSLKVTEQTDRESFTVTGTEARVDDAQTAFTIRGEVQLTVSDGLVVHTGTLVYAKGQSLVTMEDGTGPTTINRSGLEASGHNPVYDRDRAIIYLPEAARVRLTEDGDRAAVNIESARATLAHEDRYMHFEGGTQVGTGPMVLESDNMTAHFGDEDTALERLELRGRAGIHSIEPTAGGLREMRAADMTLAFEATSRVVERALLAGEATIDLVGSDGSRGARISAATMDVTLAPDGGDVTALKAWDGVSLELPDTADGSRQEIRAAILRTPATPGAELTSVRFDQGVEYREQRPAASTAGPVTRVIRAEHLEVGVEEGLSALFDARFQGDVQFTDDTRQASAAEAVYDLVLGVMTLSTGEETGRATTLLDTTNAIEVITDVMTIRLGQTARPVQEVDVVPNPTPAPTPPKITVPTPETDVSDVDTRADVDPPVEVNTPVDGDVPVEEGSLGRAYAFALVAHEVSLDGSLIEASGSVASVLTPGGGVSADSTSAKMPVLLDESQDVLVSADVLLYDGDAGQATYSGQAHLWQGATSFQGDTLTLDDQTGNLTASGNVQTSIQLVRRNETTQRNEVSLTRIEADTFVYDNVARHAIYDTRALLRSALGDLKADTIEVFLEADGRTLDRLEATGTVTLGLTDRWATGEHLVYYEAEGRYEMEGAPVVMEVVEEIEPVENTATAPARPGTDPPAPSCRRTTGRTMTFYRSTDTRAVDGREVARTQTRTGKCTPPTF